MKTIGFIKEHDDENFSLELSNYFSSKEINKHQDMLIEYMQKGILCIPLMGAVENKYDEADEEFIGYMAAYTDGTYIWPQYAIEYLKKYENFHLDSDFVSHVIKEKETEIKVSEREIKKLELSFYELGDWNANGS